MTNEKDPRSFFCDIEERKPLNTEEKQSIFQGVSSYANELFLVHGTNIINAPYFGFDPNKTSLFIRQIPTNISREDLIGIFTKIDGFVYLSLSEPRRNNDF